MNTCCYVGVIGTEFSQRFTLPFRSRRSGVRDPTGGCRRAHVRHHARLNCPSALGKFKRQTHPARRRASAPRNRRLALPTVARRGSGCTSASFDNTRAKRCTASRSHCSCSCWRSLCRRRPSTRIRCTMNLSSSTTLWCAEQTSITVTYSHDSTRAPPIATRRLS